MVQSPLERLEEEDYQEEEEQNSCHHPTTKPQPALIAILQTIAFHYPDACI